MKYLFLGIFSTIKAGLIGLSTMLVGLGAIGILIIGFLDAAFLPLPGGLDVAVMALAHINKPMMPVYVLMAIIGSTFGCLFPYWIGYKSGLTALKRFSEEKQKRVFELVEKYDVWMMLVGAVLPPPFPFKLFLLTAGVFRMNVKRFLLALAGGRVIRYGLEGWFAVKYGAHASDLFKQNYPKIGLGVALAIVLIFIFNSLRSRRVQEEF